PARPRPPRTPRARPRGHGRRRHPRRRARVAEPARWCCCSAEPGSRPSCIGFSPSDARVHITSAGRTDVGIIRSGNEDNYIVVPDRGIFVVADGMGGHAAGEVASEMAVRHVARELGSLRGVADDQVADRMRTAIRAANGAISPRTRTEHDKRGMGTTVTALVLFETRFLIGQVGDSRAYLYR